jgi:hypothetical protein
MRETTMTGTIERLLASNDPAIVYKARTGVLGQGEDDPEVQAVRQQVPDSPVVRKLLSGVRSAEFERLGAYTKWQGAHWTLACLAEVEYPQGDPSLLPLREKVYAWLFSKDHLDAIKRGTYRGQEDRIRRCASQEANAVWYLLRLGLDDERSEELVERLQRCQWPDGGWNCDKRREARTSSFIESWLPIRGLALHGRLKVDRRSLETAEKGVEFLLLRQLLWRKSDGLPARPDFLLIQYPYYYTYNVLSALKVMAETGFIKDHRCQPALDLLESKRLPEGGFPLEKKNWKSSGEISPRASFADWGPSGKTRQNDWVTVDTLTVMRLAGRL